MFGLLFRKTKPSLPASGEEPPPLPNVENSMDAVYWQLSEGFLAGLIDIGQFRPIIDCRGPGQEFFNEICQKPTFMGPTRQRRSRPEFKTKSET
jgi:hypothetical protein